LLVKVLGFCVVRYLPVRGSLVSCRARTSFFTVLKPISIFRLEYRLVNAQPRRLWR
jgi:hypothetical protein